MFERIMKYCKKNCIEFKNNQAGGINIYAKWENEKIEKYLKRIGAVFRSYSACNYEYKVYVLN